MKFKAYEEGTPEREAARKLKTAAGRNYNDGKYPNPYMQEWTKKDKGNAIWWVCWFVFVGICVIVGS
jgi:hypothetical protein